MPLTSPSPVLVTDPANFLKANGAAYIRVGSIVIATYEYVFTSIDASISAEYLFSSYILTLPAEWRFYNGQRGMRLGYGCLLFILIRYSPSDLTSGVD